ncbi:hypothetical protein C5O22_04700 [Treponema sp. J25]|nr:hypothetical protein C5O22_04700 [Treponema sp. J25]
MGKKKVKLPFLCYKKDMRKHFFIFIFCSLIFVRGIPGFAESVLPFTFQLPQDPWAFPEKGVQLTEKAKAFRFELKTREKVNGVTWIETYQDIQARLPLSLEAFLTVYLDFEGQVGFMPRLAKIQVLERSPSEYRVRHRYEVKILGYVYPSEYEMYYRIESFPAENKVCIRWSFVNSDGTLGGAEGGWFLQEIEGPGGKELLVRNLNIGLVRKDFPLQEQIMSLVGAGELEGIVRALYKEALRRGLR